MSGNNLAVPVMIGLAAGVAFIVMFSIGFLGLDYAAFHPLPTHLLFSKHPLLISGLKDTYSAGEKIDFQVTVRGEECNYPELIVVKSLSQGQNQNNDTSANSRIVWMFNGTGVNGAMLCPFSNNPQSSSTTYSTDMGIWDLHWIDSPIIINETGRYAVEAKFLDSKAEKEFTVVNTNVSNIVTVIIPEDASLADSLHNNFEPETIKVVIGQNNTVRWVNYDSVPSSVVADNSNYDSDFYNATHNEDNAAMVTGNILLPNKSFEFTFTKAGEYGYHSEPHPWMRGTVIVVNKDSKTVSYTLHIGNMTFGIPYSLSGEKSQIASIKPDFEHYSMSMVIAGVDQNSIIDLHLPLAMLKEMEIASGYHYCVGNAFVLFIDEETIEFNQNDTSSEEILTFPVSAGNHTIYIAGTDLLYDPPRCD